MKREILFKAKRLDNGKWAEGYYYKECDNTYIIEDRQKDSMLNRNEAVLVDPPTVCQFTCIYDLDGNEIFENDLVQNIQTKVVFVVVWNPIYACYSFFNERANRYAAINFAVYSSKDILIVGNRFDRKEGEK